MSEIKHTPLPWRRIAQGGSSTIVSADKPSRNDNRIPSYGYRDEDHCIAYPFIEDDGVRSRWDFVCFSHEDSAFIVEACNSYYENRAALAAKDAEIEKLKEALEAISGYENLSSAEFRKRFPEFSTKIRQTYDSDSRIGVICDFAYETLAALKGDAA